MKTRRFQVDDLSGETVRLVGQEAAHALRVLRLKPGDNVVLFDGRGDEAAGVIRSTARESLDVQILERSAPTFRNTPRLILAVAVPKGDRADWLVEQCAEFGVSEIWPLRLERSAVIPGEAKIARWRRKAVQAAKQAGHAATTTIEPLRSLKDALDSLPPGAITWFAHPGDAGRLLSAALAAIPTAQRPTTCGLVFVGPEGGFSDPEQSALLAAGVQPVRLCGPILRVETAAAAVAALWAAWAAESPAGPISPPAPDARETGHPAP